MMAEHTIYTDDGTYRYHVGGLMAHANLTSGYLVSLSRYNAQIAARRGDTDYVKGTISDYLKMHEGYLSWVPDVYCGIWTDAATRIVHLDISLHVKSKSRALWIARQNKQIAIWDCADSAEIRLSDVPEGWFTSDHEKGIVDR